MKQTSIKILSILTISLVACDFKKPKIEANNKVTKCVVDSFWVESPKSVLDFEDIYHYRTSCGNFLTTRHRQVFNIGDTITYVKKSKK